MDEWTEIRRKVLVEGASKRSIHRDYGIGHQALAKILANPEPPGYQMAEARRKPVLGPFLGVIDEILEPPTVRPRPSNATRPGGSSSACATNTATPVRYSQVQTAVKWAKQYSKEAFVPLRHPPGHAQFDFGEAVVEIAGAAQQGRPRGHHAALFGHLLPLRLSARVHRDLPGRPRGRLRVLRRRAGPDLL